MAPTLSLLLALAVSCALANPIAEPTAAATPFAEFQASPIVQGDPTKVKRSIGDAIGSLLGNLPSEIASGVPNYFESFPRGDSVKSSLGLDDSQVAALPTAVLNLPAYANYTDQGWTVRFHGNVYKTPNISSSKLDDLTNGFLPNVDVQKLPPDQAAQARNLTKEIYVIQQPKDNVTMFISSGSGAAGNGPVNAVGAGSIKIPNPTTAEGDFEGYVPLPNSITAAIKAGNATNQIQLLDVHTNGTDTGNATIYLVPDQGITIVSDIDDILRITKIYQPEEGLLNSFARPYVPWMNVPEVYANWSKSIPDLHFHYLTTTPEQVTRNYMEYIYKTYPLGSFDTRPLNFSDISATLAIRKFLLRKVFQTFPKRKFILVADTSNSDVMKDYPAMVTEFPGQVQCIFLRNTSATDSGDRFPYETSGFKDLNQNQYMFFVVPDDIKGLDVVNGQCYNSSVKQNLTFSLQGLPFGIDLGSAKPSGQARAAIPGTSLLVCALFAVVYLFIAT